LKESDIYFQVGGCYYFSKDFSNALKYFKNVSNADKSDEGASLGIYLACIGLVDNIGAIKELERYARRYPIEYYRDTLGELFLELKRGNLLEFKYLIFELAEMHDIQLPELND